MNFQQKRGKKKTVMGSVQTVFILVQVRITLGVKLCLEGCKMNPQHEHV